MYPRTCRSLYLTLTSMVCSFLTLTIMLCLIFHPSDGMLYFPLSEKGLYRISKHKEKNIWPSSTQTGENLDEYVKHGFVFQCCISVSLLVNWTASLAQLSAKWVHVIMKMTLFFTLFFFSVTFRAEVLEADRWWRPTQGQNVFVLCRETQK